MNKFPAIILLFLLFVSCDKLHELTQFEMDYDTSVTINSTVGINIPFNIYTPEIPTNSSSVFEVNNTRKDLIEEIKLKKLSLLITFPEDQNFNFLNSIEVYISTNSLDEVKIAWAEDIPNDEIKEINLNVNEIDLKDYIKSDSIIMRTKTITDRLISTDTEVDIHSTFWVDARILGL